MQGVGPFEDWTLLLMPGNATHHFTNTAVLSVQAVDATQVVTSDAFDERLADTYARVGRDCTIDLQQTYQ